MCASARNVNALVYSDVLLSCTSYGHKCVQSVKQNPPLEFGLWF